MLSAAINSPWIMAGGAFAIVIGAMLASKPEVRLRLLRWIFLNILRMERFPSQCKQARESPTNNPTVEAILKIICIQKWRGASRIISGNKNNEQELRVGSGGYHEDIFGDHALWSSPSDLFCYVLLA